MDKDTLYRTVIEMGKDIRYMREDIADLKDGVKERIDGHENRITDIEKLQSLNTGKLAVILVLIGTGILGIFQFLFWGWDKIPK